MSLGPRKNPRKSEPQRKMLLFDVGSVGRPSSNLFITSSVIWVIPAPK
jgi:hypothetical protein